MARSVARRREPGVPAEHLGSTSGHSPANRWTAHCSTWSRSVGALVCLYAKGDEVDLTFRFLDPEEEARALAEAGLAVTARLDRAPDPRVEHRSDRCYLPARAASASGSGS
ncbi:hypothetical protein [Lentzea sp. HUAS12]|uniref:hypothetical protein n=1 Tax=Lentzea sp. HUAS12 TaxID=2951806 RepID=UPI00209CF7FE|nr:hypothetical protein [Lentzea sp. HUAS12]USX52399.1 hypothetical protein ND450_45020 [Lentzea sp. HUAS12]